MKKGQKIPILSWCCWFILCPAAPALAANTQVGDGTVETLRTTIQQQQAQINELEAQNARMQAQIDKLMQLMAMQ